MDMGSLRVRSFVQVRQAAIPMVVLACLSAWENSLHRHPDLIDHYPPRHAKKAGALGFRLGGALPRMPTVVIKKEALRDSEVS